MRKEGRVYEAYDEAIDTVKVSNNRMTRTSMFWVLRDICLQESIPLGCIDYTREILLHMRWLLPLIYDEEHNAREAYNHIYRQIVPNGPELTMIYELSRRHPVEAFRQITDPSSIFSHTENLHHKLNDLIGKIYLNYLRKESSHLPSHEVRRLLSCYLSLNNERPSRVHSSFLRFAIRYSERDKSFKFDKFLKLWNVCYFEASDCENKFINNTVFPSLREEALKALGKTLPDDIKEIREKFLVWEENYDSIEFLRQGAYAQLKSYVKKNKAFGLLFNDFLQYANTFCQYPPTVSHTKILTLAYKLFKHQTTFLDLLKHWTVDNFCKDDWQKQTPNADNTLNYSSIATTILSCAYQHVKQNKEGTETLWLAPLFEHNLSYVKDKEKWMLQLANIYYLNKQAERACNTYKRLLLINRQNATGWLGLSFTSNDPKTRLGALLKAEALTVNITHTTEERKKHCLQTYLDNSEWAAASYYVEQTAQSDLHAYASVLPKNIQPEPLNKEQITYYTNIAEEHIFELKDYTHKSRYFWLDG